MVIVVSDLDGVIAFNPEDRTKYRPNMKPFYEHCNLGFVPDNLDYILTGRKIQYSSITVKWLDKNHISYKKLYMFPNKVKRNLESLTRYKIGVLEKLVNEDKIEYYEDNLDIAFSIKKAIPKTKVTLIGIELTKDMVKSYDEKFEK